MNLDPSALIAALFGSSALGAVALEVTKAQLARRTKAAESAADALPAITIARIARETAEDTGRFNLLAAQGTQIGDLYRIINQRDEASLVAAKECERRLIESDTRCALRIEAMADQVREQRERSDEFERTIDLMEIRRAEERVAEGTALRIADSARAELSAKVRRLESDLNQRTSSNPSMPAVKPR